VEVQIVRALPFDSLESVNVAITARDQANNPATTRVFSFITEDNSDAILIFPTPRNGAIQVPPTQTISFNIRRTPRETELDINGSLRVALVGLSFDENGDPILDGYGNPEETIFVQPGPGNTLIFDPRQVVITLDVDQLGFVVSISPINLLPLSSKITVKIEIADLASNLTTENFSFFTVDDIAPFIIDQIPSPGSVANSIATPISFTVGDRAGEFLGTGIDVNSLGVIIDGVVAIREGVIEQGYSGLIEENSTINGYDITLVRQQLFTPRRSINVQITVTDNSGNILRESYVFSTEDIQAPEIVFVYPIDQLTNISQTPTILIDIESEVAVEELDLSSIQILINNIPAVVNGGIQMGFAGSLNPTNRSTLGIFLRSDNPFSLGSQVDVEVSVSDVFGNTMIGEISFTVTTVISLLTTASPLDGIYDKTQQFNLFPPVGSFLDVTLTSNKVDSLTFYTLDGSDPVVNNLNNPIGTTQLYSSPIRLRRTNDSIDFFILRYFSINTNTNEVEDSQTSMYIFSSCPEQDLWLQTSLRDGLEYTSRPIFKDSFFQNNVVIGTLGKEIGKVNYIHDLGRTSFVDSLNFDIFGMTHFRVRVAENREDLESTPWCNSVLGLSYGSDVTFIDGYGPKISLVNPNITRIEGRKQTTGLFNDEAIVKFNEALDGSFAIQGDMKLLADLTGIVGAKSFFRLYDDVFKLEIQQFVSKINAESINLELENQSSLINEVPEVFLDGYQVFSDGYFISGFDGYEQLTDGLKGFITLTSPPPRKEETITLVETKNVQMSSQTFLEDDKTAVLSVVSTSPSTYNTFIYDSNERQTISFSSVPTFGTFTLRFGSEVTVAIPHFAPAAQVQLALRNLSTLSDVVVTGSFATDFLVEFLGSDGGVDQPQLQVETNSLVSGPVNVDIFIETIQTGGVVYSSAETGFVRYLPIVTDTGVSFTISVVGIPLDISLATVTSLNLDADQDEFIFAETNGFFEGTTLLDNGDYNFRFEVTYSTTDGLKTRLIANPYIFSTRQDLSFVMSGDKLIVDNIGYQIQSVTKTIDNRYIIEFEEQFPISGQDISSWDLIRNETILATSNQIIQVENPLNAVIGFDSTGLVSNIVVDFQQEKKFTYVSSTATRVDVLGTFNRFVSGENILEQQFDPREITDLFDRNLLSSYENSHINFHKVVIKPIFPTIIDRIKFHTGVSLVEKQRTRLVIDDLPVTRSAYMAFKQDNTDADYILLDEAKIDNNLYETELVGVPNILNIGEDSTIDADVLSATDLYSSIDDGFVEWRYVQVGSSVNRVFRDKIELLTRFDSYSGNSREHRELEIFTLSNLPQFVSDYTAPFDESTFYRNNKSGFAASSNNVSITYARKKQLEEVPVIFNRIKDNGIVNNFYKADVLTQGPETNQAYVTTPYIFSAEEKVIFFNQSTGDIVRTKITKIVDMTSGLIECQDDVLDEGIIVKDYVITQDQNNFIVKLEVPNFIIKLYSKIEAVNATPSQTEIEFINILNIDPSDVLGGRFSYPMLASEYAKVIEARSEVRLVDSVLVNYLIITIDEELLIFHNNLGAIVQVFNSTKVVTDYIISKTTGDISLLNQSFLSSGEDVLIDYNYQPTPYQVPNQMWCFKVLDPDIVVEVKIDPKLYNVSLAEVKAFTIDFFDGVKSQAPEVVQFEINDTYVVSKNIADATIVDGYEGSFDPSTPHTGSIKRFTLLAEDIFLDGYQPDLLESVSVRFSGQESYCIGEIEALVTTDIVNTQCRVLLNEEELFISPVPVGSFGRYRIHVSEGLLLVYFNGKIVVRRPIIFQRPHLEFGATGKILDDNIRADFRNVFIDKFFTSSPAKIQKIGRYVEIEGTVID